MNTNQRATGIMLRIVLPILILTGAALTLNKMKSMKKKPSTTQRKEPVRQVKTVSLQLSDQTVYLSGFGHVGSLTTIPISAEVRGTVVWVRENLESGEQVSKGDVLLKIDDRDVRNTLAMQKAEQTRLNAEIKRLDLDKANLNMTLELRTRAQALNQNELKRMTNLLQSGGSVSQAAVDATEQRLIASKEAVLTLRQRLTTLPLTKKSLEASLKQVDAQLAQSTLTLDRCSVVVPITGRLKDVAVEIGQLVQPGQPILRLVDDNALAIQVDLPAADVLKWMPITPAAGSSWLQSQSPITAEVTWVDAPKTPASTITGSLLYVSGVDGTTRTARLIFDVPKTTPRRFFEGMFCRVSVKGKTLKNVFKIPRRAISVDGRVPTISDGRLLSKPATVIIHQGEDVILAPGKTVEGLQIGDQAITSPVQSLPEGHSVEITPAD